MSRAAPQASVRPHSGPNQGEASKWDPNIESVIRKEVFWVKHFESVGETINYFEF